MHDITGTASVGFEVADGIVTITLNRPEQGNAITPDMARGLEIAWNHVKRNEKIRVAVLRGQGDRHFCTGVALGSLDTSPDESGLRNGPLREVVKISPHQNGVWKPVICLVTGLVVGGGLHFVVDSDIVVASENAAFMDTHVNTGQVGAIENIGLARRMTPGGALLLTLAGKSYRMPAQRACQLGLVDILRAEPDAAKRACTELANAIASNSPQAVSLSKQAIWMSQEMGYSNAMEYGWSLVKQQWSHPDFVEGPKAFTEKRSPRWNPDPDARS